MTYPKWVSRGYGLGEILCRDEAEEAAVHADLKAFTSADVGTAMVTAATTDAATVLAARKKPGPKPKVQ